MTGSRERALDFLRAGALAAGSGELIGLWMQGLHRAGIRGDYPDGLADFLLPVLPSVLIGATLGFPARAKSPLSFVGRIAGATVLGIALAALVAGGGSFLLVTRFDVPERKLAPFFLVSGVLLIVSGLRRLPESTSLRVALLGVAGLLVATRALVAFPKGANRVTSVVYPFDEANVRKMFDEHGCRALCGGGRTQVTSFTPSLSYRRASYPLGCDVEAHATLEVKKPFFEDACGGATETAPEIPAAVRKYASREECEAARSDRPWRFEAPMYPDEGNFGPNCCLVEVTARQVGDHFDVDRGWLFILVDGKWVEGDPTPIF